MTVQCKWAAGWGPKGRLCAENRKSATGYENNFQSKLADRRLKYFYCPQVVSDYEAEMEDLKESMNEFFSSDVSQRSILQEY